MNDKGPDFYLGSGDGGGDFARARAATARARLAGPHDAEYLWIRVDPPIADKPYAPGRTDIRDLIITPHYQGGRLFPINEFPMPVVVYIALNDRVFEMLRFDEGEVVRAAWGELYQTREAAAAAAHG